MTELRNFGRYGMLAVGEPKYAPVVPHHAGRQGDNGYIPDGGYLNTFDAEREALLCRIIDDRDPSASTIAPVRWRGRDGEPGQTFLLQEWGGVLNEIPIRDECVDAFVPDVEESSGELIQTDFTAHIRG